jgi:PAS domain S-box-containing protein
MLNKRRGVASVPDKLDNAFFRALFHSQLGGIAVADIRSATIIEVNELLLEILGRERGDIVGKPNAWRDFTPAEYHALDEKALKQVLEDGHSDPFEKEYQRPDGTRVPVRVSSAIVPDYPDQLIVFVTDISHERAAHEREKAVQQRLEIAISAAQQGVWDYDLVSGEMTYSPRAKAIYGLSDDQRVTFELIRDATHPEDLPLTHAQFLRAVDPAVRDRNSYEYRIVRPDGSICWALAFGEAVFKGEPGRKKAVRYVGTLQDITARKNAERQQAVLVAELNHRVKNMLAIVQSLAFQTLRGSDVPDEITQAFSGRLKALAAAHHLLSEDGWDGASIREITEAALKPLACDLDRRFRVTGEDLRLTPQAAVSLGMALYELATNALKYGALSTDEGLVELSWQLSASPGPRLSIRWRERYGPRVERPSRQGFGTRMIKRVLGGNVKLEFDPEGLACTIDAPADGIISAADASVTSGEAFRLTA